MFDNIDTHSLAPGIELFDGGGTKGISGNQ
jgi:hypothetical protein